MFDAHLEIRYSSRIFSVEKRILFMFPHRGSISVTYAFKSNPLNQMSSNCLKIRGHLWTFFWGLIKAKKIEMTWFAWIARFCQVWYMTIIGKVVQWRVQIDKIWSQLGSQVLKYLTKNWSTISGSNTVNPHLVYRGGIRLLAVVGSVW